MVSGTRASELQDSLTLPQAGNRITRLRAIWVFPQHHPPKAYLANQKTTFPMFLKPGT